MTIRDYYQEILRLCSSSPLISDVHLTFEEIDEKTGYLSGILDLANGSNLHLAEYVEISEKVGRPKYRYHWQKPGSGNFIRWDNATHHKEILTFPFHCHLGEKIQSSPPMDLFSIIKEIEKTL